MTNDEYQKIISKQNSPMSKADYALFEALQGDDADELRRALARGANVDCLDKTFITPLISAVFANKISFVRELIAAGASPNLGDPDTGNPPLAFAGFQNVDPAIFSELLAAGADPDALNFDGVSPRQLIISENNAHADVMQALGAAPRTRSAVLPARFAVPTATPLLMPKGAPWSAQEQSEAALSIGSGRAAEMARAIGQVALGAAARRLSDLQWAELTEAAQAGLSKGGLTREELAASLPKHAPEACVAYMFNAEDELAADEESCSDVGNALDIACAHGGSAQIRFWAAACGPDWNPYGMSPPLSWTVHGKRPAAARLLLELGANPNLAAQKSQNEGSSFDVSQDAPLHLAINAGQFDIAIMLLRAGALSTGTDRESLSSLRESIDEPQRAATLAELSQKIGSSDLEISARGVGALGALCACGWTRDSDFAAWTDSASAARARFGADFVEACRRDLESIAHLEVEFEAALEKRGQSQKYGGSIMDRAAATRELSTLMFLATCAGPDWNPDGGDRPIDWAANVGDADAVGILARAGAGLDADPHDADGKSPPPLARAAVGGWREAASLLLALGAEPAALQESESAKTRDLLGQAGLAQVERAARESMESVDEGRAYFGLSQLWSLAKAGWIVDWDLNLAALDKLGHPALCEPSATGVTAAGLAALGEGGYLMTPAPKSNPLGGEFNFFSRLASAGDLMACRFLARSLGPNFRHPQDNGPPLANAIAMRQTETARALIGAGASLSDDPDLLGLAADGGDPASFLMLASLGAKPSRLGLAQIASIRPALQAKGFQQALGSVIASLPSDEDGFDALLAEGSMPSALMANLIRSGEKERFWRNRDKIDWTRDVSTLVESALADGEAGLAAYARFRRGLAADDIEAAVAAVASAPALLASLSKRGLVDEAIMSALGAGRSSLLRTMADQGWPMESTMRERAAEAMLVAAGAKDPSMFEMLLPMAPADGSLDQAAQAAIAKAAWKLGGAPLLERFDAQIAGMSPQAIDACRELFSGPDGERAFAQITLTGLERESGRSRAADKQGERSARRRAYFQLATGHWSSLNDAQRLAAALSIAGWNEPGFWESAEKKLSLGNAQARTEAKADGAEAFFSYCFSERPIARAIFAKARADMIAPLAAAAQMAAAHRDDPELASIATVDAGCPCSERALLAAARLGHRGALDALLSRVEGASMKGLLSRALMTPVEADFLKPLTPGHDMPDWACLRLALAGASFLPRDIEGPGIALLSRLAGLASQGQISVERERAFSTLALVGSIPESSWMEKPVILSREPSLLEFATDADKNNPDLAKAAVSSDGMALRHAGPVARATVSVVLAAVGQSPDAFHCAHPALIQAFSLRPESAAAVLGKAADDMQSINPLRIFAKKAASQNERSALTQARAEMESSQRARSLDFVPLERAIADARLANQDRAQAEMALSFARSVRQGFEKGGKASSMDIADLRRLVERNLPDLINGYSSTESATRDAYDPSTRSTPNQMLRSGLRDAVTSMQNVAARIDDGARVALRGEAIVLESKATSADLLLGRRKAESIQTQLDVEGAPGSEAAHLAVFSDAVDAAASAIAPIDQQSARSAPQRPKI